MESYYHASIEITEQIRPLGIRFVLFDDRRIKGAMVMDLATQVGALVGTSLLLFLVTSPKKKKKKKKKEEEEEEEGPHREEIPSETMDRCNIKLYSLFHRRRTSSMSSSLSSS
jgi:hypothetical protein